MSKSFIDLFEEQVIKTPGNIAVVFEQFQLTYMQLNERANMLAHHLRNKGVKAETLVPLYIERGISMITGMLGIMKAGAAYVPIDTDFPAARISYMLRDTGAALVVSSSELRSGLNAFDIEVIEVEGVQEEPKNNLPNKVLPGQLAYIIYTSGSTGVPKGVMVEHRNLVDYIAGLTDKTPIADCRSFALVSTIATDLGNTVIYGSLTTGGTLHLFSKESVSNIELLHNYFELNKIDCLKIVPSHWKVLNVESKLLLPQKLLIFGGEVLQAKVVEEIRLAGAPCMIVNHYGPTETTIGKLLHIVQPNAEYEYTVPIGKPFSNTKVLVLTKNLKLCPIGVPGQLYITGDGVARGYLNNEALTEEKFIPNPFSKQGFGVMYSTGDMVKYLPDGNISFIGRVDNQVKIRGYRIELGEIENILHQCNIVDLAVVRATEDKQGSNRLVAYILAKETFDREEILAYLQNKLPDYMIPSLLIEMEQFPLTANGKIDRNALPDPDMIGLLADPYVAPRNEVETKLAALWQDVLEEEKIGVNDDFFELGGHSLLAVRLVSAIRKAFVVEMPISDIFDYPTVAMLAKQVIFNTENSVLKPIEVLTPRPARIPLSFSQERLWFIDRLEGSVQYHVPAVLNLKGTLNTDALNFALKSIVNRHEVLRTVIREEDGQPYQYVKEKDGWGLSRKDKFSFNDDDKPLQQYIVQLISKPFDLAKDHMLRAALITVNAEEHLLVTTLHHIASDGWSKSIFVKEVVELYNSFEEGRVAQLAPLKVQYADYAIWQRNNFNAEVIERKLNYWKEKLKDVASLQLPADHKRPSAWSTRGVAKEFKIDKGLSVQLLKLSLANDSTLFMTLLAAFKILLHRYSGQQDICVGTPIAGRQQAEVENLIGFFINTLALRNEVRNDRTFKELLQQVKQTTLDAFAHQEVPFEKVVDALVSKRDLSRNPLFQVMFILRNTPDIPDLKLGEVELTGQGHHHASTLFDITLFITENQHGMHCSLEYATSLYKEETIGRMALQFKELLHSIVTNPEQKIGELQMISAEEKHQLLVQFNDTKVSYPANKSIVDLFEEQVLKTPDAIAVEFEQQQLSYKQLNQKANQLARHLKTMGIKEEMLVPVCVARSPRMIIGILGILKTGAAFVPVDPEYPVDRITYMLADTAAKIVISESESIAKLEGVEGLEIIQLDSDWASINEQDAANLSIMVSPLHLAYVIYTSGSTGMPKGVMIEHGSVVNLLKSIDRQVGFNESGRFLSVTTFSFDICYLEFFVPVINGGRLIIVSRDIAIDGFRLARSVSFYQPTHMQATPVTWQLLMDANWKNNECIKILIGGDAVNEEIKEALTKMGEVYNLYGPTETTIWSVTKKLETNEKVLIGKPIANTAIYIVDELMQIVPVGVAGEICIGGAGLARGYLNRPDLSAQKFICNPFSNEPLSKIYKTGDMGRWLPDGNLECLGRIDDQVKIRGYRIEPGEIESVLVQSKLVSQAVVLAKEDKELRKKLIGYYVPDWQEVKQKELRLYETHIDNWKQIYETEYSQGEATKDEEFDINIWKDSFTGEAIGEQQMHEWLQDIVEVIVSEKPGNVLEIGCGTGLIYYQLAGKVNKYTGTDISVSCINHISQRIKKGLRDYGPTELKVCAAHEISLHADEKADTIIMNSIVQYFPGEGYMDEVIDKCLGLLNNNGRIIIGDVRDNRLLPLFKGRLQLQSMVHPDKVKEFEWAVEQEVLREEELCFCPEYFYHLQKRYPQISHVEIKWKEGLSVNELTLYRYTVVLHVGAITELTKLTWQNWKDLPDKQVSFKQLADSEPMIALKNVPNFRLWREAKLSKALNEKRVHTVGDLSGAALDEERRLVKSILETAEAAGYHIRLLLNEDKLLINLVMELEYSGTAICQPFVETPLKPGSLYTNIPLFSDISLLMQKDLKALLKQSLPEYMIPSELVALSHLPLTNNGKTDRRFLSGREDKAVVNKINYQPPVTDEEQTLAGIWQQLLGVKDVGIHDNFFDLGGHSLLAMRLVSAMRRQLNVEVAVKALFDHPTISGICKLLKTQTSGVSLPPIETLTRPSHIPLSFSQERLWFIDQLGGSVQYHLPAALRLRGALNKEAMSNALKQIVNRHQVLRSVIVEEKGVSYQLVKDNDQWQLQLVDGSKYKEDLEGLQQYIKQYISFPFNLKEDYMLRAALISLATDDHLLVVTLHHIASDGWSNSIIVKELVELYNAFVEKRPAALMSLPVQFADYAIWQRKYLQGVTWDKKLDYWKNKLADVAALQLPTDYPRPSVHSYHGAIKTFKLDKELSDQLNALSQQQGATLFMTLLAAINVLFYRYSGQKDICIGTPVAGRQQHEVEGLVGFFVNMLALRCEVSGKGSFTDLLQQVRATSLEAYDQQEVPFEKVVELVVKDRDMSRSPVFQVMLVLQNTPEIQDIHFGELQLSPGIPDVTSHSTTKFELTFNVTERINGLNLSIEYCRDLYHEQTISRMMYHLKELLNSVVKDPGQSIELLPMLTSLEERQLLVDFNDTLVTFPGHKNIVALFEQQVLKTPEAIAAVFEEELVSYDELNKRSNLLAHYLAGKGVKAETLVPVCLERSIEMIVAILGILKAGGAYVPVDPEYPSERIDHMLKDVAAALILTSQKNILKIPDHKGLELISLDNGWPLISNGQDNNLNTIIHPGQLAYVIYTSGSTGQPKGAMNEHRAVVNRLNWAQSQFNLTPGDAVLQKTTFCFDVSVWELLWPLLVGAKLVFAKPGGQKDNAYLKAVIEAGNITMIHFVPSMLAVFLPELQPGECKNLKQVLCSGEALKSSHVDLFKEKLPGVELHNLYGPTEAAIDVTHWNLYENIKQFQTHKQVPVGKPVSNTFIYILDKNQQLVPVGVSGEIHIGGVQVGRGYLKRPELTEEKFVENIFNKEPGTKMYKTGDLGRWLSDGNIEYLGRLDDQVKIRGYRIELGEIESILQQSGLVSQAAVLPVQNNDGVSLLVGYVLAKKGFTKEAVLNYLSKLLPEYMIPQLWVKLEQMPLTSNGKTDKTSLPKPDINSMARVEYVAPSNELEKYLADLWQQLLGTGRVGIFDNFFELGGHSLLVMRMMFDIKREFSVELSVRDLFQFTTINDLSKFLETRLDTNNQEDSEEFDLLYI